ncbi:MAG: hypothetical protein K2G69_01445, partial [Muribaculaceae bacterium]|nr:hypothetical protein [Muribaculaceae bacterium]
PVMNDMLVQQYGLSASGEQAAQIASMLGKVMEGQTGALSRYGYKFDEAQEKILKYGTETERVAVLVDVVSQSVGGMNREMAQTESGKMQQLANKLGDMKEQLGGIAKRVQVPLTLAANFTVALGGVTKLVKGMKDLIVVLNLTKAAAGWITLAITALGTALVWLFSRTDEAADSLDRLADAEERAARAAEMAKEVTETEDEARRAAISSIELNISRLKDFNGTKAEEKKIVKEMNDTYGDTMGYFSSVSEWYQTLVSNSEAYCRQMVIEAKTRRMADQIAELDEKKRKIVKDEDGNKKKYSTERKAGEWREVSKAEYDEAVKKGLPHAIRTEKGKGTGVDWANDKKVYKVADWRATEAEEAQAAYDDFTRQEKNLQEEMKKAWDSKPAMPVTG